MYRYSIVDFMTDIYHMLLESADCTYVYDGKTGWFLSWKMLTYSLGTFVNHFEIHSKRHALFSLGYIESVWIVSK